jgi:hypothetical protein
MDADTEADGDAGRDGVADGVTELLVSVGETVAAGETGAVGEVQPARSTKVASQIVRGNTTPHRYTAAGCRRG